MGKANRKPRPSVPNWVYWDRDGCWNCSDRNHCNNCKANKKMVAAQKEKQDKREKQDLRKNVI